MLGALPQLPINQFKSVQKNRQQELRAYCQNMYTVPDKIEARKKSVARGSDLRLLQGYNNSKIIPRV